ncbi:hypothetical protein [Georgenia faecalis]|uniref:Universal stress protein n=1 Tax=Georgenia faecalis TaxID=2483799 RepID=A0ABV9DCJ7_9MICO|nr:hypothetical protein [Georgenia faecalis]
MTETVLILTEDALAPTDVRQIVDLYTVEEPQFQVLVPADTERNVLVEVINHLSLLELREAWDTVVEGDPDDAEARTEASEALSRSLAELRAAGVRADGAVVSDDPLPALTQAVNTFRAMAVVVVTRPRALDDTFRRDWASRAREALGVPVLHLYTGSSIVG